MKLKRKLFSSMAFVLSLVMLAVSGAIFVHSAQQQSASTSLSVTFSGQNVNCSVEGWYQVKGDTQRTALKNSTNGTKVTFSATEGSTEKTLEINNVASENKAILTSQKEYVLFTYKFTNTASDGAYGIEVSLTLNNISNSNLKAVKYGTSSSLYTNSSAGLGDQYTTLSSSSDTVFTDVFIVAGGDDTLATGTGIKYFYILLEVNDLTLPVSFNPDFTWTIDSSSEVEDPSNIQYTLSWVVNETFDNVAPAFCIVLSTAPGYFEYGAGSFWSYLGGVYDDRSGSQQFDPETPIFIGISHYLGHPEYITYTLEQTTPTSAIGQGKFNNNIVGGENPAVSDPSGPGAPPMPGEGYAYYSFTMDKNYTLTFSYSAF